MKAVNLFVNYCFILGVLALGAAGYVQAAEKTLVVMTESWPRYTNKDGSGYYFDLLRQVYEPLGYQIEIQFCPWRRCIREVAEGRADIIPSVYKYEKGDGKKLIVPQYPIYVEKISAAFLRENEIAWRGQETLRNKPIVQSRGYDLHLELSVPVINYEVATSSMAWRFLLAGRAEFYITDSGQMVYPIEELATPKDVYRIEHLFDRYSYFGFSDSNKGRHLITEFEERFPKLHDNGVVPKLQEEWSVTWPIGIVVPE